MGCVLVPLDARLTGPGHVADRKWEWIEARGERNAFLAVNFIHVAEPDKIVCVFKGIATPFFLVQDALHGAFLHPPEDFFVG